MKYIIILLLATFQLNIFGENTVNLINKTPKRLEILNYNQLQKIINKNDNKLYVVNFWATWCKPCVEELPSFMEINAKYKNDNRFKMILVSLDLAKELESRVKPFISKKEFDTDVFILNDIKKMNEWIPSVDSKWTGAIPATVLYKNGIKLYFKEGELTKNELNNLIIKYL